MRRILEEELDKIAEDVLNKVVQRIEDHIERVQYFYKLMVDNGIIPKKYIRQKEIDRHDEDKLYPKNLERQSLRYAIPQNEMTPEDIEAIDNVITEHVKSNPHHCEYWGSGDHHTLNMDCTAMPLEEVYQMIADWTSTAEEKSGNNAWKWYYDSVVNVGGKRWIFSDEQIEVIEKCLEFLEDKTDHSLKRNYGLHSFDPAVLNN